MPEDISKLRQTKYKAKLDAVPRLNSSKVSDPLIYDNNLVTSYIPPYTFIMSTLRNVDSVAHANQGSFKPSVAPDGPLTDKGVSSGLAHLEKTSHPFC